MRSVSPKSNHFFTKSKWCFYASLVKIHQLVKVTKIWSNRQTIPTIVYEVWPESTNWSRSPKSDQIVKPSQPSYMKFGQNPPTGQGHQNLIKSSNHPNHRIWSLARIHQLVKFTKIWSNHQTIPTIVYEVWPESTNWSRSPKSDQIVKPSQPSYMNVWPESTNWSRSPKSDQIIKPSHPSYMKFGQNPPTGQGHQNLIKSSNHPNHRTWSLARIHQLVKVTKIWSNRQTIPTIVYEVWPESTNWSRSPKSDQIVKPSQPSYMKFGQNPPTGQGHQNLIKSSNHPNHRIWSLARIHQLVKVTKIWSNRQTIPTIVYEVWPESTNWSRSPKSDQIIKPSQPSYMKFGQNHGIECRQAFFILKVRKLFSFYCMVTLKIRSRSLKPNQIFKPSQYEVWPESDIWFKRWDAVKLFGQNLKNSKCCCDLENEVKVTKI